jgi:hypothetical protein
MRDQFTLLERGDMAATKPARMASVMVNPLW